MRKKILLINGVNLDQLGVREYQHYGNKTLADIVSEVTNFSAKRGYILDSLQSNIEGEIVEMIHRAHHNYDGVIINAGAYSHYSIAIHDALKILDIPIIEVHLSNIYQREEFRHFSYIAKVAIGGIFGLGAKGYVMAADAIIDIIESQCK
jgi:3-dehydroquinate dehydratase type II